MFPQYQCHSSLTSINRLWVVNHDPDLGMRLSFLKTNSLHVLTDKDTWYWTSPSGGRNNCAGDIVLVGQTSWRVRLQTVSRLIEKTLLLSEHRCIFGTDGRSWNKSVQISHDQKMMLPYLESVIQMHLTCHVLVQTTG